MQNIMNEVIRLLVIGSVGSIISIFNILDNYANVLIGAVVGFFTIIFLIFQIIKIRKEIQLKNIELCEKRLKLQTKDKEHE